MAKMRTFRTPTTCALDYMGLVRGPWAQLTKGSTWLSLSLTVFLLVDLSSRVAKKSGEQPDICCPRQCGQRTWCGAVFFHHLASFTASRALERGIRVLSFEPSRTSGGSDGDGSALPGSIVWWGQSPGSEDLAVFVGFDPC